MAQSSLPSEQQRQQLYYSRLYATGLLLLALVLFIVSCFYLNRFAAMAYIKAFAEAAMVGALADWFAITALFRHPLGLPIPHTAILARKQHKIADELGRFIEHNFLQGKAIAIRLYQWHPTQQAVNWLSQPNHQQQWLPLILKQLPILMRTAKPNQIAHFISQLLDSQYSGQKLGITLANLLTLLRQQHIDLKLCHVFLQQIRCWLQDQQTRTLLEKSLMDWAGKIKKEDSSSWDKLKASLKSTFTARIDDWVATKALNWADTYIEAALNDPNHPLWRSYRKEYLLLERQLRRNTTWHNRLAAGRHQLTQSDALQQSLEQLWQSLINWSEDDIGQPDSWWQSQCHRLIEYAITQSKIHPQCMRRLDTRFAIWIRETIECNKHYAGQFVANKVKAWNSNEMIDKIELSIGRDLQFIRINGTIVGGCIGLVIYSVSQLLIN